MMSHNVEKATSGGVATKVREVGRPRFWSSPQELDEKIEQYHAYCKENNKPFLITGLAFYCGIDRKTLLDYKERDEFLPTLKKMRQYAEFSMEEALLSGKAQVGAIFSLKNNFGWVDAKQLDVNQSVTISSVFNQLTGAPIDAIDGQIEDEDELLIE